jgi:GT2 family glycosyltransferase
VAFFNGYKLGHLDRNKTCAVDAGSGAFLMMPSYLYQQLGGFDETFFMYGEDLDLCWRIKAAGYQVVYYADVKCIHLKGQSGRSSRNDVVQYHFYNAMLIFYDRYYVEHYPKWLTGIIKHVIRRKMPKI